MFSMQRPFYTYTHTSKHCFGAVSWDLTECFFFLLSLMELRLKLTIHATQQPFFFRKNETWESGTLCLGASVTALPSSLAAEKMLNGSMEFWEETWEAAGPRTTTQVGLFGIRDNEWQHWPIPAWKCTCDDSLWQSGQDTHILGASILVSLQTKRVIYILFIPGQSTLFSWGFLCPWILFGVKSFFPGATTMPPKGGFAQKFFIRFWLNTLLVSKSVNSLNRPEKNPKTLKDLLGTKRSLEREDHFPASGKATASTKSNASQKKFLAKSHASPFTKDSKRFGGHAMSQKDKKAQK